MNVWLIVAALLNYFGQGILKGKYHCAIDLLLDWFGIGLFCK
jgi:hypothetical protein